MFADDHILLSNSIADVQAMVTLCADFFDSVDLAINVNKCCCLRIGPRFNAKRVFIKSNGISIPWVKTLKYLGVQLLSSAKFRCDYSEQRKKFFRSFNAMIALVIVTLMLSFRC